jgi:ferredoxin-fold anticodon binding domain-containing protein
VDEGQKEEADESLRIECVSGEDLRKYDSVEEILKESDDIEFLIKNKADEELAANSGREGRMCQKWD